jgi:hypothetical protein
MVEDPAVVPPAKKVPFTRAERNRRHYVKAGGAKRKERYKLFREFIDTYKVESGCVDCGYNAHPAALEFDHRDPSLKVAGIARMFTYTDERLFEEMAKCDVRCSNCHRIKTFTLKEAGKQGPADWDSSAVVDPGTTNGEGTGGAD